MSLEEQDAFFEKFDSVTAFEAWMSDVKQEEYTVPVVDWEADGKLPDAYTWEEYQLLDAEEQDAFFHWFASEEAFVAWAEEVRPKETTVPESWNKPEKLPSAYTWEEYQELSGKEQETFFSWFGSVEKFEEWQAAVKPQETTASVAGWNKPGALPNAYTWEEYQALSREDQDAFALWFGSEAAFDAWVVSVKPAETTAVIPGWDKTGKQPDAYTWEEYQALSPLEQDAFFRWFGSVDAFERWMETVKPTVKTDFLSSWDKPGKLPNEYTWEEYQKLSPEDQERFYFWFETKELFEAWMDASGE
jgi:hypothetical protein